MTISACGCDPRPGKPSVIAMVENNISVTRTPAVPGVLDDPMLNRGVAFTSGEREALGLAAREPRTLEGAGRGLAPSMRRLCAGSAWRTNWNCLHLSNEIERLFFAVSE